MIQSPWIGGVRCPAPVLERTVSETQQIRWNRLTHLIPLRNLPEELTLALVPLPEPKFLRGHHARSRVLSVSPQILSFLRCAMKRLVPIPSGCVEVLKKAEETGMGYQVVLVELKDGRAFDQVI